MSTKQVQDFWVKQSAVKFQEQLSPTPPIHVFIYDRKYNHTLFQREFPTAQLHGSGWLSGWEWHVQSNGGQNIRPVYEFDARVEALTPLEQSRQGTFGYVFILQPDEFENLRKSYRGSRIATKIRIEAALNRVGLVHRDIVVLIDPRDTMGSSTDFLSTTYSDDSKAEWIAGFHQIAALGCPYWYVKKVWSLVRGQQIFPCSVTALYTKSELRPWKPAKQPSEMRPMGIIMNNLLHLHKFELLKAQCANSVARGSQKVTNVSDPISVPSNTSQASSNNPAPKPPLALSRAMPIGLTSSISPFTSGNPAKVMPLPRDIPVMRAEDPTSDLSREGRRFVETAPVPETNSANSTNTTATEIRTTCNSTSSSKVQVLRNDPILALRTSSSTDVRQSLPAFKVTKTTKTSSSMKAFTPLKEEIVNEAIRKQSRDARTSDGKTSSPPPVEASDLLSVPVFF